MLRRCCAGTAATLGPQLPASFISLAEDTGLIVEIGAWVLEEACRQLHRWREELPDLGGFTMAVNLSPMQLGPALVDRVGDVLDLTDTDPASITLGAHRVRPHGQRRPPPRRWKG